MLHHTFSFTSQEVGPFTHTALLKSEHTPLDVLLWCKPIESRQEHRSDWCQGSLCNRTGWECCAGELPETLIIPSAYCYITTRISSRVISSSLGLKADKLLCTAKRKHQQGLIVFETFLPFLTTMRQKRSSLPSQEKASFKWTTVAPIHSMRTCAVHAHTS